MMCGNGTLITLSPSKSSVPSLSRSFLSATVVHPDLVLIAFVG